LVTSRDTPSDLWTSGDGGAKTAAARLVCLGRGTEISTLSCDPKEFIDMSKVRTTGVALAALSAALLTTVTACGGDASTDQDEAGGSQVSVTEDADISAMVPEEVATTGTLRVASEAYPPAVIVPPSGGDPSGWEVAIAKDVATVMGLDAEITIVPFDGLIPSLQANRFDVAMGEIAVLPERTAVLMFVSDHESGDSFLVNESSDVEKFSKPEDLCGQTVGALLGSVELATVQEYAATCEEKGLPALTVNTYKDQAAVNLALQGQKVDVSIGSTSQLSYVTQQASGEFRLIDAPFIETIPTGVAIADTPYDADMAKAVQAAVQQLIDSGRMQEILDEFNSGKGNVEKAEIHP